MQCSVGKLEKGPFRYENVTIPKLVDWRLRDIVGPIKDQVCIDTEIFDMHLQSINVFLNKQLLSQIAAYP